MSEADWEKLEPSEEDFIPIWTPETLGEVLEGKAVDIKQLDEFGIQLTLEMGDVKRRTPCHRVLQSLLKRVVLGDVIKITYVGEKPSNNPAKSPMRLYDVERRRK